MLSRVFRGTSNLLTPSPLWSCTEKQVIVGKASDVSADGIAFIFYWDCTHIHIQMQADYAVRLALRCMAIKLSAKWVWSHEPHGIEWEGKWVLTWH